MALPMTPETRSTLDDRLRMISEELRSLLANYQFGVYRKCLSNLYYACFHAANLLLESKGLSAKSHTGTNSLFAAHFVKGGAFDKTYIKSLSKLESQRQTADYQGYVIFDEDDLRESLALAIPFLEKTLDYLKSEARESEWQILERSLAEVLDSERIKTLLR